VVILATILTVALVEAVSPLWAARPPPPAPPPPSPPPPSPPPSAPPSPPICLWADGLVNLRTLHPPLWCSNRSNDKAGCLRSYVSYATAGSAVAYAPCTWQGSSTCRAASERWECPFPAQPPPPPPPEPPPPPPPNVPPERLWRGSAALLNARFTGAQRRNASWQLENAGVVLTQFDGRFSSALPWSPCPKPLAREEVDRTWPSYCRDGESFQDRRISGSIIGLPMRRNHLPIPIFNLGAGVVLRPGGYTGVRCMYGVDGDIHTFRDACGDPCPGCDLHTKCLRSDEFARCVCGFGKCGGHVYPWGPGELDVVLRLHAKSWSFGYGGMGSFSGYNEAVLDPDLWIEHLPASIEAVFFVDPADPVCDIKQGKRQIGTCVESEAQARRIHGQMLQHYNLRRSDVRAPALVGLRPSNWDVPFRDA